MPEKCQKTIAKTAVFGNKKPPHTRRLGDRSERRGDLIETVSDPPDEGDEPDKDDDCGRQEEHGIARLAMGTRTGMAGVYGVHRVTGFPLLYLRYGRKGRLCLWKIKHPDMKSGCSGQSRRG